MTVWAIVDRRAIWTGTQPDGLGRAPGTVEFTDDGTDALHCHIYGRDYAAGRAASVPSIR